MPPAINSTVPANCRVDPATYKPTLYCAGLCTPFTGIDLWL